MSALLDTLKRVLRRRPARQASAGGEAGAAVPPMPSGAQRMGTEPPVPESPPPVLGHEAMGSGPTEPPADVVGGEPIGVQESGEVRADAALRVPPSPLMAAMEEERGAAPAPSLDEGAADGPARAAPTTESPPQEGGE